MRQLWSWAAGVAIAIAALGAVAQPWPNKPVKEVADRLYAEVVKILDLGRSLATRQR